MSMQVRRNPVMSLFGKSWRIQAFIDPPLAVFSFVLVCRYLLASMQSDKSSHPLHLPICRIFYTTTSIKYIYLANKPSWGVTQVEIQSPAAFDISCQLSQRPRQKQCPPSRVECAASIGASDGGDTLRMGRPGACSIRPPWRVSRVHRTPGRWLPGPWQRSHDCDPQDRHGRMPRRWQLTGTERTRAGRNSSRAN